jgi:hypothetical protein
LTLFSNFEIFMLRLWTIRFYVSASGRPVVRDWYDDQIDDVRAKFDTVLEYLVVRRRNEWGRPEFAPLSGKHSGLGELRFDFGKLEYRPIGCFGPNRSDFTILIGATKKGKNYEPRNALDTALERRDFVGKVGRTDVYDF